MSKAGTRMQVGWMTEALADLEAFAEMSGLSELREQLSACRQLASAVEDEQMVEAGC